MAADSDALERRIAMLESRIAALTALISASSSGALTINAPGGISISAGGALTLSAGSHLGMTAGNRMNLTSGREIGLESRDIWLAASVEATVESGQTVSIDCRDASFGLKKDGSAVVKGKDVTIQASGKINAKASSDVVIRGSKILQN
ncbi:MAG: hypothetical protein DI527_19640 [Chelatococcus sp.]|nr:MAG: hypothetical protein DI527_19640 [Chelatococcus sp.]